MLEGLLCAHTYMTALNAQSPQLMHESVYLTLVLPLHADVTSSVSRR